MHWPYILTLSYFLMKKRKPQSEYFQQSSASADVDHELNDTAVFLLKYKSLKYFQIIRQRISFCFRIANFGH